MKGIRTLLMASVGAASLVACGSFSSDNPPPGSSGGSQSGGTTVTQSGGSGGNGGTTTTQSGGSGGNESGGTTVTPSGGSGGNDSGGTTVKPSGTGGSSTPPGTGGRPQGTGGSGTTPGTGGGSTPPGGTGGKIQGTGGSGTTPPTGTGGSNGTGGSGAGGSTGITLPCDVLNSAAGNKCVSAHSTVRVIVSGYTGPLYTLCKGSFATGPSSCKGTTQDVGSKDGYADVAAHDAYCPAGTSCRITKIYDQSGQKNDLEPAPAGGAKRSPDNPALANDLKVKINGHSAYGILIKPDIGYRTGCSACNIKQGNGMVKGDNPQTHYWVTSQKDLIDGCCFDYGNAETTSNDDGNGTMETLYFGGGVVWGTGYGGKPGPWIMADLENGLYAGWENKQDKNISTNKKLPFDFVHGILLGDTRDKNGGKGRFALLGGDATAGTLQVMYDGIRPEKTGYVPMQKQGSIILGIGGDNSNGAGGRFYEGAVSAGPVISKEVCDQLQAAIVAAKYQNP